MSERFVTYKIKLVDDPSNGQAADAIAKARIGVEKRVDAERQKRMAKTAKAEEEATRKHLKLQDSVVRNRIKMVDQIAKHERKARQDEEKQRERVARNRIKLLDRIAREQRKKADQERRAQERAAREEEKRQERVARNRIKMLDRMAKHEAAKRKERERAAAAEEKRITSSLARSARDIEAARGQMLEGFEGLGEAVGRVGRGIATLGLISENTNEKFLKGLAKVIAGFDLFTGSIRIVTRMITVMDALRKSTLATATAQELLNAAQSKGIVTGAAGTAGSTAGGALRGAAGSAGAGAAGAAAGSAATGGGLKAAAAAGMSKVGGLAVVVAKFGAVALGATEVLQGTRRALGDSSKSAESFVGALLSWRKASKDAQKITKDLARAEAKRAAKQAGDARKEALAAARLTGQSELASRRDAVADARMEGLTSQDRRVALMTRFNDLERQRRRLSASRPQSESGRQFQAERLEELTSMQIAAVREERQIREKMIQDRRAVIQQGLDAAKQELELSKQRVKAEQDRLLSAKERFGQMDPVEQARMIQLKRRAETQGTAGMTTQELRDLQSIGTGRAGRMARDEFIGRANLAGFDRFFGQDERRNIAAERRRQQQLKVEIADKRTIALQLDQANDDFVKRAAELVVDLMERQQREEASRLMQEVERRIEQVNRTSNSAFQQRAATVGR